jgi:DNA-binding response OmpR family regulator
LANILLLEDDLELAADLAAALSHAGHQVTAVSTVDAALSRLDRGEVDLAISDFLISEGSGVAAQGGITFVARLKQRAIRGGAQVPVIAISAGFSNPTEISTLDMATQVGADYALAKPFEMGAFLALVQIALHQRGFETHTDQAPHLGHILLVEPDFEQAAVTQRILETAGYQLTVAATTQDGLDMLRQGGVDLVVSGICLPKKADDIAFTHDGFLALRKRAQELDKPPRVVALWDQRRDDTSTENAFSYDGVGLAKPFTAAALLSLVEKELAARART